MSPSTLKLRRSRNRRRIGWSARRLSRRSRGRCRSKRRPRRRAASRLPSRRRRAAPWWPRRGDVHRAVAVAVASSGVGAGVEQHLDHVRRAGPRGGVQRRVAVAVRRAHRRARAPAAPSRRRPACTAPRGAAASPRRRCVIDFTSAGLIFTSSAANAALPAAAHWCSALRAAGVGRLGEPRVLADHLEQPRRHRLVRRARSPPASIAGNSSRRSSVATSFLPAFSATSTATAACRSVSTSTPPLRMNSSTIARCPRRRRRAAGSAAPSSPSSPSPPPPAAPRPRPSPAARRRGAAACCPGCRRRPPRRPSPRQHLHRVRPCATAPPGAAACARRRRRGHLRALADHRRQQADVAARGRDVQRRVARSPSRRRPPSRRPRSAPAPSRGACAASFNPIASCSGVRPDLSGSSRRRRPRRAAGPCRRGRRSRRRAAACRRRRCATSRLPAASDFDQLRLGQPARGGAVQRGVVAGR